MKFLMPLLVVAMLAVGCGDKNDKTKQNSATPGGKPVAGDNSTRPESDPAFAPTFLEGFWETGCLSDEIRHIQVQGDIMTFTVIKYSSVGHCTEEVSRGASFYRIVVTADNAGGNLYDHRIDYLNAEGVQVATEFVGLSTNSSGDGLIFSDDNAFYNKRF